MPTERISIKNRTDTVFGKMPVTTVTFLTSLYDTKYRGVRTMLIVRPEANLSHGALEQLAMEAQQPLRNLLTPSLKSGQPVDTHAFKAFQENLVQIAGVCQVNGKPDPQNVLLMCQHMGYSH